MRIRTAGRPANPDAPTPDAVPVTASGSPRLGRRGFLKLTMAASGCLALGIAPSRPPAPKPARPCGPRRLKHS